MPATWNFADIWETIAKTVPDALAQRHGLVSVSWRAFDQRASGVAHGIVADGLARQDKVALYLHNGPEYLQAVFGCLKASLVPVNTNYRYLEDELVWLWQSADAAAVVFQSTFSEGVGVIRQRYPGVRLWLCIDDGRCPVPSWATNWDDFADTPPSACRWQRSGDDLILIYTGGTTGRSRGVMWRQHDLFLASNTSSDPDHADLEYVRNRVRLSSGGESVTPMGLPAAPLMLDTPLVFAATVLNRAETVVTLTEPRFDAVNLLESIGRERVTDLCFVGDAFCRPIADALDAEPQRWSVRSLKAVSSSGMAWSAANKARLLVYAPDELLIDFLNSSEASGMGRAIVSRRSAPDSARFKLGERAFVVDEALQPVAPGSGVIGRIAVRGPIPLGYYKDPGKSADAFPIIASERCVIPGDFATVEADGTIKLLGRGSVRINTGGEKVYPDEFRACVNDIPGVVDALVVGIPDERFGERVAALLEMEPGHAQPSPQGVSAFVPMRLAGHKVPRLVCFVETIGRGPNGKADYPAARGQILKRLSIGSNAPDRSV